MFLKYFYNPSHIMMHDMSYALSSSGTVVRNLYMDIITNKFINNNIIDNEIIVYLNHHRHHHHCQWDYRLLWHHHKHYQQQHHQYHQNRDHRDHYLLLHHYQQHYFNTITLQLFNDSSMAYLYLIRGIPVGTQRCINVEEWLKSSYNVNQWLINV